MRRIDRTHDGSWRERQHYRRRCGGKWIDRPGKDGQDNAWIDTDRCLALRRNCPYGTGSSYGAWVHCGLLYYR